VKLTDLKPFGLYEIYGNTYQYAGYNSQLKLFVFQNPTTTIRCNKTCLKDMLNKDIKRVDI